MNLNKFDASWLSIIKAYDNLGPKVNMQRQIVYPYQGPADRPILSVKSWPYTCGWGHLLSAREEESGVEINGEIIDVMHDGLTFAQADQLLVQDLAPRIAQVAAAITQYTDHEFGAFVDLVFNSGPGCLTGKPGTFHNAGKKIEAAQAMLLYINAGHIPYLGLWRRRLSDAVYYLSAEVMVANNPPSEKAATERLSELIGSRVVRPGGLH